MLQVPSDQALTPERLDIFLRLLYSMDDRCLPARDARDRHHLGARTLASSHHPHCSAGSA